ncbi:MAG: DNA repair exonuclease [Planctomycetes bacterium]|nr:DNA repair exonuclease [Planctomycetota bacterium]
MAFRFLTAGDIHLGRRPARVPRDQDSPQFAPRHAWDALVASAIAQQVDAVALTGDVVDQENRFYEAFSDLHRGVRRLVDAGIAVVAVAGNHDCDVLPRLAAQIDGFRLLGRDGRWEAVELNGRDGTRVRFVGWSFPRRHVTDNPLAAFEPPAGDGPVVGLLHCDCPSQTGPYAPVTLEDFRRSRVDLWALGHIHNGRVLGDDRPIVFYPGSLQGLDPTEDGPHGAWAVTLEAGRPPAMERHPLAALQWAHLAVPLEGAATIEQAVTEAVRALNRQVRTAAGHVRGVGCRLRFTGRTALSRQVADHAARLVQEYRPSFDGISYFIETVDDDTRPDVALEALARADDPAGLLARRLLVLDARQPREAYEAMLAEARRAVADAWSSMVFSSLDDGAEPLTDEKVRQALLRSGFDALDRLLAQKEGGQ